MPKASKRKSKPKKDIKVVPKDWLKPNVMIYLQEYQVHLLLLALAFFKPRNSEEKHDTNLLESILLKNLEEQTNNLT